jgi:hypothetical protein
VGGESHDDHHRGRVVETLPVTRNKDDSLLNGDGNGYGGGISR